jgi:hypothetical protein
MEAREAVAVAARRLFNVMTGSRDLDRDDEGQAPMRRRSLTMAFMLTVLTLSVAAGCPAISAESRILFPRGTEVAPPVQEFAWRVIETRCAYQSYERQQRSFWAYDAQARKVDTGVVYSLSIASELPWKKTEPPALIEMTIVDDGRLQLASLKSSFIACEL